jgi:hypothetical protein
MSEDSILLDIVEKRGLITVFASSLIVIICVLMKN